VPRFFGALQSVRMSRGQERNERPSLKIVGVLRSQMKVNSDRNEKNRNSPSRRHAICFATCVLRGYGNSLQTCGSDLGPINRVKELLSTTVL
jgi:hypothetical protein